MPKFFVKKEQIDNNKIVIVDSDVNHIKTVLRMHPDDEIEICNLDEQKSYNCIIKNITDENVECIIKDDVETNTEPGVKVTIFQGLPKSDKMELVIQKAVELGVFDITPVEMARCIVKLNDKEKNKKIERWQKIAEVAAKQCNRNIIPEINPIIALKNICDIIDKYDSFIIAYEKEHNYSIKEELKKQKEQNATKIGILIGPEGGLEEKEVELLKKSGAKVVTLGNRILRTETVALNVLSNIMYEFDN